MCYDLLRFSLCFKICAFSTSPPLFPFPFCLCGISVAALFGYGVPCELWFSGRLKEAVGRLIFCSRALVQSSRAPLFACRDSTSWFSSERAANNQPFFVPVLPLIEVEKYSLSQELRGLNTSKVQGSNLVKIFLIKQQMRNASTSCMGVPTW